MMREEDEEEIIFDRTGYRHQDDIRLRTPSNRRQTNWRRGFKTFCLYLAFFGLGLCIAIPGPTLIDLQTITNTTTEEISRIFTGRSLGYLFGSIVGGVLFDHLNQDCLLTFALMLTAAGTAVAPWSKDYRLMMGLFGLQGLSMGFLDTGGNVMCLELWGRDSGPYVQALHFSFGVGAFLAPLIAEPFLGTTINTTSNLTIDLETGDILDLPPSIPRGKFAHHSLYQRDADVSLPDLSNVPMNGTTPKPHPKPISDGKHFDAESDNANGKNLRNQINSKDTVPPDPDQEKIIKTQEEQEKEMNNEDAMIDCVETFDSDNATSQENCTSKQMIFPSSTTTTTTQTTSTVKSTTSTTTTTTTTQPSTTKPTTPSTTKPTSTIAPYHDNDMELDNVTDSMNATENSNSFIKQGVKDMSRLINHVIENMSKIQFAYLTIAIFLQVTSFLFFCLCCLGRKFPRSAKLMDVDGQFRIEKENIGFRVQILILLFVFYFFYVGMEVTYGGLIMTFSVRYLNWSKTEGSMLTSLFWGSFATGRGLAIFLAKCLSPVVMLIADLLLTTLSLAGLVMVIDTNSTMLWFCTATLGLGLSSIFPTGITWAERYMHITGKATAVFVVGSALGEMAMPAIAGMLFDTNSPMWLLYITLASSLISAVTYIIMQNLASNKGERYHRVMDDSLDRLVSSEVIENEDDSDQGGMETVLFRRSYANGLVSEDHGTVQLNGTSHRNSQKKKFSLPGSRASLKNYSKLRSIDPHHA